LRPFTEATITDPERLAEEIEQVRRQGWAIADQELAEGLRSVAARCGTPTRGWRRR